MATARTANVSVRVVGSSSRISVSRIVCTYTTRLTANDNDNDKSKRLAWDREDALDCGGVLGMLERGVVKRRADRRGSGVTGADGVRALVLEVVEERADQRRVGIVDFQAAGLFGGALGANAGSITERVAVGSDRVRAGVALADQAVCEEHLSVGASRLIADRLRGALRRVRTVRVRPADTNRWIRG
jgi:hypothetical protein